MVFQFVFFEPRVGLTESGNLLYIRDLWEYSELLLLYVGVDAG